MNLIACIGPTDMLVIIHFVDAVHVVYDNFRSYTGSTTALEYGIACSMSSK